MEARELLAPYIGVGGEIQDMIVDESEFLYSDHSQQLRRVVVIRLWSE